MKQRGEKAAAEARQLCTIIEQWVQTWSISFVAPKAAENSKISHEALWALTQKEEIVTNKLLRARKRSALNSYTPARRWYILRIILMFLSMLHAALSRRRFGSRPRPQNSSLGAARRSGRKVGGNPLDVREGAVLGPHRLHELTALAFSRDKRVAELAYVIFECLVAEDSFDPHKFAQHEYRSHRIKPPYSRLCLELKCMMAVKIQRLVRKIFGNISGTNLKTLITMAEQAAVPQAGASSSSIERPVSAQPAGIGSSFVVADRSRQGAVSSARPLRSASADDNSSAQAPAGSAIADIMQEFERDDTVGYAWDGSFWDDDSDARFATGQPSDDSSAEALPLDMTEMKRRFHHLQTFEQRRDKWKAYDDELLAEKQRRRALRRTKASGISVTGALEFVKLKAKHMLESRQQRKVRLALTKPRKKEHRKSEADDFSSSSSSTDEAEDEIEDGASHPSLYTSNARK
jgi:hypothetical protein